MSLDPRTPVLVGVGAVAGTGEEAAELMAAAVVAAAADACAPDLLPLVQEVAVPEGTWSYSDPGRLVADSIGAHRSASTLARIGVSQQTLTNRALHRILTGAIDVAVVVGGDTKLRATTAARSGGHAPEVDQCGASPDVCLAPADELMAKPEVDAGLWDPVAQYALIENALGHADGLSCDDLEAEVAELWSGFSRVAAANPAAAFGTVRDADAIRRVSPHNRLLAFPYNKWHSTQWRVDQAAALLLCSAQTATDAGVPRECWVFPRVALESSHSISLSRRRHIHRWPAMHVLGRAAAAHLRRPLATAEHVELYSCFPAAVRVQQRELGLPLDGVPTVTGGMTFAGGPFNNFTYQATAAVVGRVRTEPGTLGLVTTVSGLLTKPGLMVWSTDVGPTPPLVADLAEDAAHATATMAMADRYAGPATVATYTVMPDGDGPARVAVIGDTPDGRVVATCKDRQLAERAMSTSIIGSTVCVDETSFVPQRRVGGHQ